MYNEKDIIAQWNADMYDLHETYTDDVELALMFMGSTPKKVLEIACGSGRFLIPVAKAGHDVTGLDFDAYMLERLSHKITSEKIKWRKADVIYDDWGTGFDVVTLGANFLFNIVSDMNYEQAQKLMIRKSADALDAGGHIFVDYAYSQHPEKWFHNPDPIIVWEGTDSRGSFGKMALLDNVYDEVQYAPELFSYIKIAVDSGAAPGTFWLTGSQAFRPMELAQESLAGRIAILRMPSLSQHEIYGQGVCTPFSLELESLKARKKTHAPTDMAGLYERIWGGSMPGLVSGRFSDRDVFYSSYLQTYIERDVKEQVALTDTLLFSDFIRSAACRAGQMLNVHDIAQDVGVSDDTAKRWLGVLEKSGVVFYLRPYSNNLLKRTIKTPKLYFFDAGLVAYLTRYSSPEILANGAMNGAILENYVVAEVLKGYHNNAKDCLLWYYRDKDNREVNMVIEADGQLHPLEIKRAVNPAVELVGTFGVLDKVSVPRGKGAILCMCPELSAVDRENFIVPVWMV